MRQEHPVRLRPILAFAGLLLALVGQSLSHAQDVSEDQVKAAYLFSFAKFIEWPAETFTDGADPIRLCILNNPPFQAQLNQIIKDKRVANRPVVTIAVSNGGEARGCQVLFICSSQNSQTPHILSALQGSSVLTVGETTGFVEEGGILNLVLQNHQVHFQVNHKAATQAGLRVSARLLSLAKLVIE